MSFRVKPIVHGLALAFGGLALAGGVADPVYAQGTQALERATITGSNIRRTDQESIAPVEIITRESIERTGSQTVAEVLQKLPITSSGVFNETANSFAPGSTTVSLRGLGQDATLVLLNGRRIAGYGFAQNIQDSFVDLSAIPTSAIERIEILKDGASAIYGSDAIAGVVNVILRRDYKGLEASANIGFFQGENDYRASLVGGFGDLGADKFNVFGVIDYYKRDGLTMADTDFGASRDYRGRAGGRNFQSLTGGGTWTGVGAAGSPEANLRRANAECPNAVNYQQAVALGLLPVNQSALPLGTGANQPGNTWCARDFANVFSVVPETERIGFLGRGTVDFTANMQGYAELGYSRNETDFIFQEPFFAGTTRLYPVPPPANLAPSPFNARFTPGTAGNPLGITAQYSGVLNDFGTRDTNVTSDSYRILAGLKYSLGTWDLDSAVGWSKSDVTQESKILFTNGTINALGLPDIIQTSPPPTTSSSVYNLNQPSLNSPALRASMFGTNERKSESELKFIDTKATTEIGALPGGPVGLALGIEYREESIQDIPTELARTGGILGQGSTFVDGERDSLALFGELALPLTRQLEGQLALRYDDYSDFGSSLNPKVGMKFRATPELLFRANWGRGFKAPSLPEITPSSAFFFTVITEPLTGAASQISGSINANPSLQPEKSRSFTAGVVFEPSSMFSASMDFYQIKWTNQVAFEDFQAIADNPSDPRAFRDPVTGFVLSIAGNYINLGEVETQGVDLDFRYKQSTTYGRVGARLNANYVDSYQINGTEVAGTNLAWAFGNISAIPRWKGLLTADWEKGPWVAQLTINYLHHYWRTFGTTFNSSFFRPGTAGGIPQTGQLDAKSPSYTTYDLYGRYNITPKFGVSAAVINVTDEEPVFDPSFSTTYFFDRQAGYDIRGRTFRIGVDYKFF